MLAVEFETHVENGIVKIPAKFREMMEGKLKIILLKPDQEAKVPGKQKTAKLKRSRAIIEKGCDISSFGDPVQWQREVRKDRKIPPGQL